MRQLGAGDDTVPILEVFEGGAQTFPSGDGHAAGLELENEQIAVASGRSPTKTIEWAEVTCCSAIAVSSGKPTTTPHATMTSDVALDLMAMTRGGVRTD